MLPSPDELRIPSAEDTVIEVSCRSADLVDSGNSRRMSTHYFRCSKGRSVRTKLMIAAAAGISCATILLAQEKAGQSSAITKIQLLGAKIEWKESAPGRSVVAIDLAGSDRFGDLYVPLLDAFPTLERLDLSKTAITDAGLKRLRELPALTELKLSYTDVTDAALADLRKFKSLRRLDLEGTQITDAGLRHLGDLQSLTQLNLVIVASITDGGLKEIARLRNLVDLDLTYSSITDVGLAELRELKELRRLNLRGTRITDAGLTILRDLPHLSELNLADTDVTPAGFNKLAEHDDARSGSTSPSSG